MKYTIIPVTPYQQNCTLLVCEQTGQAAIVDPGGDIDLIVAAIDKNRATVNKILLTHGHLDHVGGTGELAAIYSVPVIGPHEDDRFWLDALPTQSKSFGISECASFTPDIWLKDGDEIVFGKQKLQVLHCPGHTPGHVVFYHQANQLALVGDVLFRGAIGRTDFPKGNYQDLIDSIKKKLWPLGGDTQFIPGHGPMSTFALERIDNPYVADN